MKYQLYVEVLGRPKTKKRRDTVEYGRKWSPKALRSIPNEQQPFSFPDALVDEAQTIAKEA